MFVDVSIATPKIIPRSLVVDSFASHGGQSTLPFATTTTPRGQRLWVAGDLSLARRPSDAIVGSRNVSKHGAARTQRPARELVAAGVVVVSGLATGVYTLALRAAIDASGRIICAIRTPLDVAILASTATM